MNVSPRITVAARDLVDSAIWFVAIPLAVVIRYGFQIPSGFSLFGLVLSACLAVLNLLLGLIFYRRRRFLRPGFFDEGLDFAQRTLVSVAPVIGVALFLDTGAELPRSTLFIASLVYLFLGVSVRTGRRIAVRLGAGPKNDRKTCLIYGSGLTGQMIVRDLRESPNPPFRPVGFIDDVESKRGVSILGIPVLGTQSDFARVVEKLSVSALIMATPKIGSAIVGRLEREARRLGVEILVAPERQLSSARYSFQSSKFRELGIEDLVGRRSIEIDEQPLRELIGGKTVLITGAGGSIGAELASQVSRYYPGSLMLLDRDETALQNTQISVSGNGLLTDGQLLLADIRDSRSLDKIFSDVEPDVVIHAAALKHLSLLEEFPFEAWKTNVVGTANVLAASKKARVKTFVNVSTDKAADPSSVLGRSKKLAECLTAWYSEKSEGRYRSVRFGNVLGSRGSLVPVLRSLIEKGGPVQITSAEATRFFMSVDEACQLVLQAASDDQDYVFVLDMGEPVRILSIAEKMIELSGLPIEIEFTGLRPGEKEQEVLFSDTEKLMATSHPLISGAIVEPLDPRSLGDRQHEFLRKD